MGPLPAISRSNCHDIRVIAAIRAMLPASGWRSTRSRGVRYRSVFPNAKVKRLVRPKKVRRRSRACAPSGAPAVAATAGVVARTATGRLNR